MTTMIVKNSKIIANMYLDLFKTPIEQRAEWLKNIWKEKKGYDLDLMHPRTSTEKFQWYKLYYDPDFLWRCLDKIEFKSYVNERFCGKDLKNTGIPQNFGINTKDDIYNFYLLNDYSN